MNTLNLKVKILSKNLNYVELLGNFDVYYSDNKKDYIVNLDTGIKYKIDFVLIFSKDIILHCSRIEE